MAYVDIDYYLDEYYGDAEPLIPDDDFELIEKKARKYLDFYTFGRIKSFAEEELTEDIKNCMCELCDLCYRSHVLKTKAEEAGVSGVLTSYSNDGVSGTYASNDSQHDISTEDGLTLTARKVIKMHLCGSDLLYTGI